MALARIFVLGVILTTPVASLEPEDNIPQTDTLPAPRLERLEKLMEEFQSDWRREKQVLTEKIKLSQIATQELTVALTRTQAVTENVQAENQGLKAQIGEMQRELDAVKQQQLQQKQHQSLKLASTAKGVSECSDGTCLEDAQKLSKFSVNKTTSKHGHDSLANPQHKSGHSPAQNSHGVGGSQAGSGPGAVSLKRGVDAPSRQVLTSRSDDHVLTAHSDDHVLTSRSEGHMLTSRSDDFGPLEVEVSQLAQAVTGLTADVQALQTSNTQLLNGGGSSFVQWGSSTCGGSAQLVYSGEMGGSRYDHTGAAANPLCLTLNPILLEPKSGASYTNIYGAEFATHDDYHNRDPLCAVCRTPHQTTIMVPGTNVCSAGWTRQYSGFLMAGHYTHVGATQFICVDSKMESEVGSQDDHTGHLLYYTQTRCGSLPCPPYQDAKVMTCVVCSK